MRFATILLLALATNFAMTLTLTAQQPLKSGDRIVFLGDSITAQGAGAGGYVTQVRETLNYRHKDLKLEVIGAGISGNKVPDLEKRLDRDVLTKKPTIVVIYIGINDVWHSIRGQGTSPENFEQGLKRIIKSINDAGARVILCTATVIGEKLDGANALDKQLDEYCAISRKVAAETKSQMLDLRQAFLNHLKNHNMENKPQGILTTDTVHLNAAGNKLVASQMLGALGVDTRVLRHVVLFKFKPEVTPAQVQEVVDAFGALPSKISEILEYEAGTDVSVENKADGFTHGFLVTFRDAKGREIYLPHPAHQEFVKLVGPRIDKVLVFDYWTKRE